MKERRFSKYSIFIFLAILVAPPLLGMTLLNLWHWDFTVPFAYGNPGADEILQLILTKTLFDTGWVLSNPYLSAPSIAQFYSQSVAQTSALHSILMLLIKPFEQNPIAAQQIYYILNFSLITGSSYLACRLLRISRSVSFTIGILFSFTSFRIHALFWAFLANYFTIPLGMLVVLWVLTKNLSPENADGRDPVQAGAGWLSTPSRRFYFCIPITIIVAIADGYYAFFTLLLLGFAVGVRILKGDLARPSVLLRPVILIGVLLGSALALQYPISQYRATHANEVDQDLLKQPTDAEVYSGTIKFLIAPATDHRVAQMGALGKTLIDSGNFNRKFPLPGGAPILLATLGTILLIFSFYVLFSERYSGLKASKVMNTAEDQACGLSDVVQSASAVSLFVLLTSVTGGVGTLIAFVYPSIRAYERFVLFLVFSLFLAGGAAVTIWMGRSSAWRQRVILVGVGFVGLLAFLDQTPKDLLSLGTPGGERARSERFLAERKAVQAIEANVRPGAMIYQFPYSQYLTDNKYYGWGQFGQMRFYLNSKSLRWSNGGTKGSAVENWHERMAALPLMGLMSEMRAAGFSGVAVDRLVIPEAEYATLAQTLTSRFGPPKVDDQTAKLSFWVFPPSTFKVQYDKDFIELVSLTVDSGFDVDREALPRLVDPKVLRETLVALPDSAYPLTLTADAHPTLFRSGSHSKAGFGQAKFSSPGEVTADVSCAGDASHVYGNSEAVELAIQNRNSFDWAIGVGSLPLRVVANIYKPDGTYLTDIAVPWTQVITAGTTATVSFPVPAAFALPAAREQSQLVLDFAVLQDGNIWFRSPNSKSCRIKASQTLLR